MRPRTSQLSPRTRMHVLSAETLVRKKFLATPPVQCSVRTQHSLSPARPGRRGSHRLLKILRDITGRKIAQNKIDRLASTIKLAINTCIQVLSDTGYLNRRVEHLVERGLTPGSVELEHTERDAIKLDRPATPIVRKLTEAGFNRTRRFRQRILFAKLSANPAGDWTQARQKFYPRRASRGRCECNRRRGHHAGVQSVLVGHRKRSRKPLPAELSARCSLPLVSGISLRTTHGARRDRGLARPASRRAAKASIKT